jgi:putative glycerol-1-phosphate prenyltransferase
MSIYRTLQSLRIHNQKGLAVLIDPDKVHEESSMKALAEMLRHSDVSAVFIGGSLMIQDHFHQCIKLAKKHIKLPLVIFPGSPDQVSDQADAILLLSLISGRNADLLIGHHVTAAPKLAKSSLEIISTGYMLVDCGNHTTASYVSQTFPLPYNKPEIAAVTAMAGEMIGMKCMYLDGGSGAQNPVSPAMISAVRNAVATPIIVGGGIRHEEQAREAFAAGADLIVVGTAVEENPELLFSISNATVLHR